MSDQSKDLRGRIQEAIGTFTFHGQKDADFARLVDVVVAAVRTNERPQWVQNCIDGAQADVNYHRRSGPHFVKTLLDEIDRLEALLNEEAS